MVSTVAIRGRTDNIACGSVQRYGCVAGIVYVGAVGDALTSGGNTRREGDTMDAAGAVTIVRSLVVIFSPYADVSGGTAYGAVVIVVVG